MEKIQERTRNHEIAIRQINEQYYQARMTLKLGGAKSTRLNKGL